MNFKKLNLLIGLLIGFTILSCSSDDDVINDTPENSYLLKSLTIEESGNVITKWEFEYDNNILTSVTKEFDEKLVYNYLNNGLLDNEKKFLYNNANQTYENEIQEKRFLYENGTLVADIVYENEQISFGHDYILNNQGKIKKYIYNDGSDINTYYGGKRVFEYNSGNVVEQIQTDSSDNLANKYQYMFDNNKNPFLNLDIQIKRLFWFDGLNSLNDNNITSYVYFDSSNSPNASYSYVYQYNDKGFPISRKEINDENNEIIQTMTFQYYEIELN